jgi:hypothetical protein
MSLFNSYPVMESVIVNLKDKGHSFRGVIWKRVNGYLVLRNGELLKPGGDAVAIDGELLIQERDIEFLQVLARAVV